MNTGLARPDNHNMALGGLFIHFEMINGGLIVVDG
jgi:hypothetical protein